MRSVSELMRDAEDADTAYRDAVHDAATARAKYENTYYLARMSCGLGSVSGRKEHAENVSASEHSVWLIKEAAEKAAKTHIQVLLGLLIAAQSEQKFMGRQDGGTDWGDF